MDWTSIETDRVSRRLIKERRKNRPTRSTRTLQRHQQANADFAGRFVTPRSDTPILPLSSDPVNDRLSNPQTPHPTRPKTVRTVRIQDIDTLPSSYRGRMPSPTPLSAVRLPSSRLRQPIVDPFLSAGSVSDNSSLNGEGEDSFISPSASRRLKFLFDEHDSDGKDGEDDTDGDSSSSLSEPPAIADVLEVSNENTGQQSITELLDATLDMLNDNDDLAAIDWTRTQDSGVAGLDDIVDGIAQAGGRPLSDRGQNLRSQDQQDLPAIMGQGSEQQVVGRYEEGQAQGGSATPSAVSVEIENEMTSS